MLDAPRARSRAGRSRSSGGRSRRAAGARGRAPAGSWPSTRTSPLGAAAVALEDLDGGRLAGAVGAEQAEDLAALDLEGEPAHGLDRAVGLAQVGDLDRGRARSGAGARAAAALAGGEAAAPRQAVSRVGSAAAGLQRGPPRSVSPTPSIAARRSASIVSCGKRASASAISSARSRWRPAGTISVSRPIACASSASTMRPVRIRSSARPSPTMRGSRCVPPSISGTPQRRSVKPSRVRRWRSAGRTTAPARGRRRGTSPRSRRWWAWRDHPADSERAARVVHARREALDRLEVGARAERHAAGAGDHQHARIVVGLEAVVGAAISSAVGPSIALRRSWRSIVRTAAVPRRS